MTESQAYPDPDTANDVDGTSTREYPDGVAQGEPEWPSEPADEPRSPTATLVGCTIALPDQLPAARVLRDSFLRHHPSARFALLAVARADQVEPGEALLPADIGVDDVEFAKLAMACTAEQLRAVLRPRLLTTLLSAGSTVLALEPFVQVFGAFDDVLGELSTRRPVALVPRALRPLFADGLRPDPADLAEAGAFDQALFAVCPGAEEFLAAWAHQVSTDPTRPTAVLDGVGAFVDHQVLRDPGIGLSVWNAAQRELWLTDDGRHLVDGHRLRSVHFDGFQPQRPWLLSVDYADRPRVLLSEHPGLAQLCAAYRNELVAAGYAKEPRLAHRPFDTLPDGCTLPEPLRAEFLRAWLHDADAMPASPFELATTDRDPVARFLEWAATPADERQRAAGLSRWAMALWTEDPALRRAYPAPLDDDAEAFREWCAGVGVASNRVPSTVIQQRTDDRHISMVDQLGVAVLGTGRLAELVRAAVRASGLPSAETPYYPVVLRCDPAVPVPSGHHVVDIRPDAVDLESDAAEVWVLSEASLAAARRRIGPVRMIALPLLEEVPTDLPTRKAARARYEISEEYVFAAFVDHADERDANILGLVSAFFAAFPDEDTVRLLVHVSGERQHPEAAERLRLATVADPRVVLVEGETDANTVLAAADCVVSLHRGEGGDRYAVRLLEAAARALPVISGNHGAAAELLGEFGAKLVPCQGVGEPDLDAAASALREAASDPTALAEFGVQAREHLLDEHNVTRAGERLRDRVEHAYRGWRVTWAKDRHGQVDDPLHPLLVARHALNRTPDVGGGNAMAPALRKAVLRALSHYDEHIRDIMRTMIDGIEQTAADLLRRQYDLGGTDLESLRAEVGELAQRQERLAAQLSGTEDGVLRAHADLADQYRRMEGLADNLGRVVGDIESLEQHRGPSVDQSEIRAVARDAEYAVRKTDVLQRVLLREHERNTGSADVTTSAVLCDAGLLRLPNTDSLMLPWLSSHDSWDAEVSALIDSLLEPDGAFLDIGAYAGYQTVRVLSRLGTSGAVVAVEPCAESRDLLRRNVEVNVPTAGADRLVVIDGAAWDAPGELAAEPALSGGVAVRPAEGTESGTVRAVRLDREWESLPGLEGLAVSVIHVDVGARVHRILGGLVRLLRRDRPSVVCSFTPGAISELGDDPAAALREFGTWGYDLVPVGRDQAVTAAQLLEALETSSTSTVKLWLRPRSRG